MSRSVFGGRGLDVSLDDERGNHPGERLEDVNQMLPRDAKDARSCYRKQQSRVLFNPSHPIPRNCAIEWYEML